MTPILYTMENAQLNEIFDLLLSKGADINEKDIHNSKMMKLFFIMIIFNKRRRLHKKNKTALHYAAQNNAKEIGEILISKGVDVNAKDIHL